MKAKVMNKHKIIFFIFTIVSVIFLVSGVVSAYNLAQIEHQKNGILNQNPQNLKFYVHYNVSSYYFTLHMRIFNPGPFEYKIFKITWVVYLVNGTMEYQANNYARYYPSGSEIVVSPGKYVDLTIVDNTTTGQWESWVLHNLKWQIDKYGDIKYVNWKNVLYIYGMIGDFNGEQYRYNYRTWYLWELPEVKISYDKILNTS